MARNRFKDPAGRRASYDWAVNHNEEDATSFKHNIETTPSTSGRTLIRQQGADSPAILKYSGTILRHEQVEEMGEWFDLCYGQTIEFRDCSGDEYEVFITAWDPKKERVVANPRDSGRPWIWRYSIEMQVIEVKAGVHEGIVVP